MEVADRLVVQRKDGTGALKTDGSLSRENGWLYRYERLVQLMYMVRRLCPRVAVLGISTLHPRHPLMPDQLDLMRALDAQNDEKSQQIQVPSLWLLILRAAGCLVFALREVARLLWMKLWLWPFLKQAVREPTAIVMKTWCFGTDSFKNQADFYYGKLPKLLEQQGIRPIVLCDDVRNEEVPIVFAHAALSQTHLRYIPEKALLPWWAPFASVCHQWRTALRLRHLARTSKEKNLTTVFVQACLNCLTHSTTVNLFSYYIARVAVAIWHPKVWMTLYEGQPWEKLSWHGAKAADPRCLTVGYQHTIVMPHSLSLLKPNRESWEFSTPDVALCLGRVTCTMMKPGHEPFGVPLIPFGSFRRSYGIRAPQPPEPARRTILVIPEGHLSEAKILFDFALSIAPRLPDHRILFRCHPILPFGKVRAHLKAAPERFPNIEISRNESIEPDFARSSVVFYRGSSAVLYAVLHGLKPIYLREENHPPVDPLFELMGWREHVSSADEMAQLLEAYAVVEQKDILQEWRSAAAYVHDYSWTVDEHSVDRFLDAAGLKEKVVG